MKGHVAEEALAAYGQLVAESQALDFSEGDTYDFARCMRPDGSFYGTSGKCRKGTEAGAKEEATTGRRPRAAIDSDAKQVIQQMKGAKGLELLKLKQKLQDLKAQARAPRPDVAAKRAETKAARKPRATSAELKTQWGEAQKAAKAAKAEEARVRAETKGDKSREALKRRLAASNALDRAERAALKIQDRFFAAAKRESRAAMTPEQRREEREWDKQKRQLG